MKKILVTPISWFQHLSRKKKIIVVIIVIAILLVGGSVSQFFSKPTYTFVKAEKSDITEIVSETGSVLVNNRTDIYSPTNGIVESVLLANGDIVTIGAHVMTIKSSASEQEKSHALAALLSAKNSLDTAQATLYSLQATMFTKWNTFKQLAENDTYEESDGKPKYENRSLPEFHVAEKEWLAAESNYKKQQAVISQAQASVTSANLLYQATQNAYIKATTAGVVENLSVASGSAVQVKSATNTLPLFTIISNAKPEVFVTLTESDISKIKPGQPVDIDVGALNKSYGGTVDRVDAVGTEVANVMRYNAYISFENFDEQIRPGMTVDVEIVTNKVTGVLSLPNSSIKPYQGGRAVRVYDVKTKQVKNIPVQIGIRGVEKTQILSGIEEGTEVISTLSNEQLRRPGLFGN